MTQNATAAESYVAGLDENGLGARLGPMLVTGVLVAVDERGRRWLSRRLSKALAKDLDDSKRLVSFQNSTLAEAWTRALVPNTSSPAELLSRVSLTAETDLRSRCPKQSERQCWTLRDESFEAEAKVVARLERHLQRMAENGVNIVSVKSEVLCVARLNDDKQAGGNRFVSDLHAMERLLLSFHAQAKAPLEAQCGKVGGMADYDKYFGPLSGWLRTTLKQAQEESAYHFPGLGRVRFIRDADASHPIVMLASVVGKYLRELLMGRISGFYTAADDSLRPASGYHDPVSSALVSGTLSLRKRMRIQNHCFERIGGD